MQGRALVSILAWESIVLKCNLAAAADQHFNSVVHEGRR